MVKTDPYAGLRDELVQAKARSRKSEWVKRGEYPGMGYGFYCRVESLLAERDAERRKREKLERLIVNAFDRYGLLRGGFFDDLRTAAARIAKRRPA